MPFSSDSKKWKGDERERRTVMGAARNDWATKREVGTRLGGEPASKILDNTPEATKKWAFDRVLK